MANNSYIDGLIQFFVDNQGKISIQILSFPFEH